MDADALADCALQLGRPIRSPDDELEQLAARAVTIDQTDLAGEFSRVAGDLAYFGSLAADAEADYLRAKDSLELCKATALQAAAALAAQAKTKATADQLKAQATMMPQVAQAQGRLINADTRRRQLRAICDGVSAKLQALISLGAHVRREMGAGHYTT
jgi:multidrug resistance efflux pump